MTKKLAVPEDVSACLTALRRAGYRACPVGGCVRDGLLGRVPEDWDLCTDASPEQLLSLFPRAVLTGGSQGTVTVPLGRSSLEITPFRREGRYADGRHPGRVVFGVSLEEDLARRDFTINAMALDGDGTVVDLFGGQEDLARGLIRCVGDPETRFREDGLRMFRAVRFSAQLGFDLEEGTLAAIAACAPLAAGLSAERVGAELEKTICSPRAGRTELLVRMGLLARYLDGPANPGLARLEGLPPEPVFRWAGLCAALIRAGAVEDGTVFLKKLRRDGNTVRLCAGALALWKAGIPGTERDWRYGLARYGERCCLLAAALAGEEGALERVRRGRPCVRAEDLALSGAALQALGLTGAEIGRAQRALLEWVLDHPEENTLPRLQKRLEQLGHI